MRPRTLLALPLALAAAVVAPGAAQAAQEPALPSSPLPPEGSRWVVFVSDLHVGVGIRPPEAPREDGAPATWENTEGFAWHPTEDFRWHREFGDFLQRLDAILGPAIDLVILGDFLELWQSLEEDCDHSRLSKNYGCTEEEAVARAQRVLEQHDHLFRHLAGFADREEHRVVLVPGNHDIALAYPRVQALVADKFKQARRGRFQIAGGGYWRSRDGRIYAEHGQQIGRDPNKFTGFPRQPPLLTEDGVAYLQQTWGEQFVQEFFNSYEEKFPVIDNVAELIKGIGYARQASDLGDELEDLADGARFLLTRTSWAQTGQVLGENGAPEWDLPRVREIYAQEPRRGRFLTESLPAAHPLRQALEARLAAGEKLPEIEEFEDEEINVVCSRRWAQHESDPASGVVVCPDTGRLGALAESLFEGIFRGAEEKKFRSHLVDVRDGLPADGRPTPEFGLFVYGHTHKETSVGSPFGDQAPWRPVIFNDGAWQRTVTPRVLCTLMKSREPDRVVTLDEIRPEDLPPCYPFVLASHGDGRPPRAQLLYWVQEPGKPGALREGCTAAPAVLPDCE